MRAVKCSRFGAAGILPACWTVEQCFIGLNAAIVYIPSMQGDGYTESGCCNISNCKDGSLPEARRNGGEESFHSIFDK